jgi:hypothetical protein
MGAGGKDAWEESAVCEVVGYDVADVLAMALDHFIRKSLALPFG